MASDETDGLTPANQNPWYVLMTLYGEQEGPGKDYPLAVRNASAWNAWIGQVMNDEGRKEANQNGGFDLDDLSAWPKRKDEISKKHAEVWIERNADLDYPGLPDPEEIVDLSNVLFAKPIYLCQLLFNTACFNGSKFEAELWFENSRLGAAWFYETVFCSKATFGGTRFLSEAIFDTATFLGALDFGGAKFRGQTRFSDAVFSSVTYSFGNSFSGRVVFVRSTFMGLTYFSKSYFGSSGLTPVSCRTDFTESVFQQSTSFLGSRFALHYPVLTGTNLHPLTTFTAKERDGQGRFWPPVTPHTPFLAGFHLPKNDEAQPAEEARDSLAAIRHNIAKQGLPKAQHFFFRREMHFAGRAGTWLQGVPYELFRILSDYGHGIGRPALILLAIWAAGVAAILHFGVPTIAHCPNPLVHSASTSLNFFGFLRGYYPDCAKNLPDMLKTASALQTFASYILLFFLGLGLRQRFRLR